MMEMKRKIIFTNYIVNYLHDGEKLSVYVD